MYTDDPTALVRSFDTSQITVGGRLRSAPYAAALWFCLCTKSDGADRKARILLSQIQTLRLLRGSQGAASPAAALWRCTLAGLVG